MVSRSNIAVSFLVPAHLGYGRCCQESEAASSQHGSAVTYQLPAFCFLGAVLIREEGKHDPKCAASAEAWDACIQVMADDAHQNALRIYKKICTCLLWGGCRRKFGEHIPIAVLRAWCPSPAT